MDNKINIDLKIKKKKKKKVMDLFEKPSANKSINSSQSKKVLTYKQKVNKRFKQPLDKSNSLTHLSKISKINYIILRQVYNRGTGAARTAGISRPSVKSKEQWSYGRVYAFIEKVYNKNEKQNQDADLIKEARADFEL